MRIKFKNRKSDFFRRTTHRIREILIYIFYTLVRGRSLEWMFVTDSFRKRLLLELNACNLKLHEEDIRKGCDKMRAMPVHIYLQNTLSCNFRCIMCTRQNREGERMPQNWPTMSHEIIKKVAGETFPYASVVELSVAGEPLIASNLDEILSLAKKYEVKLSITTNGSMLSKEGMLDKLMPVIGGLILSIDASSAEMLSEIRPGSDFDSIVEGALEYDRRRKKSEGLKPEFHVTMVLMKRNILQLTEMVRLAKRLGADKFHAVHVIALSEKLEEESLGNYPDLFDEYREKAIIEAEQIGQDLRIPPPLSKSPAVEKPVKTKILSNINLTEKKSPVSYKCQFLCSSIYVHPEGWIIPCCSENPDPPSMGNVMNESIWKIWNSPAYVSLRKELREGRLPELCRSCHMVSKGMPRDYVST